MTSRLATFLLWIFTSGVLVAENPFVPSGKPIKGEPVDNAFRLDGKAGTGSWALEFALFPGKVSFPYLYLKKFSRAGVEFKAFKLDQLYSKTISSEGKALAKVPFTKTKSSAPVASDLERR